MEEDLGSFTTLEHIVARLRAPDGCPWDRKQTHASIKPYLIEEAYEVLQALDDENSTKLCEELGDLLLQILLHAQIAAEVGEFETQDVVRGIATKLLHRHPHIFGNNSDSPSGSAPGAANAEEVAQEWEVLKQNERGREDSLLASVPKEMPALAFSQSIQRRAAGVGFDWRDSAGVLDKLEEEVAELKQVETHQERVQEFGDILFALVNVARWQGVDLEEALRLANDRFCRRFSYMEKACRKRNVSLHQLSFEEQNALWDEAKQEI